jgi:histidine triad (HIT) family protein
MKESKSNCVFCKILSGEFPCSEIYRDEEVVAFLDIQPVNPGHVLIIPVEHYPFLEDLNPDVGAKLFKIGQKIARAIRKSEVRSEGINFLLADGEEAGQEVWHTHLHVFPRYKNDGFGLKHSEEYFNKPERNELDYIASVIKSCLD